jgi:hypothetical protein
MGTPLLVSMIQSDRERLQRLFTERREVASDDGKIKVTVPDTWSKLPELHKQASLQVGNKSKEVYLIVVTGAKTDLDNFILEKYHQQTRDRMLQKMKNASASQPVSATIDGHPALQDELTRILMSAWLRPSSLFGRRRSFVFFQRLPNYTLARTARMSRKRLGYPAASNETAALRVHFCPRGAKCM